MAKKTQRPASYQSLAGAKPRLQRAAREGRFMQALELARQLYKAEPTPAHRDQLFDVQLGRARQLRGQGKPRDALTVLHGAAALDDIGPERVAQLAEEMASCGALSPALALLDRFPESPTRPRVLARAADAALEEETSGKAVLPEALHADFNRVRHAFGLLETGQDDEAREVLQGIGLRSPFLEWKLLLRGLEAYYRHEDARALENWQRLSPDRLPARLAAPLRFQLDRAYQATQPPATQAVLQQQLDRLQDHPLVQKLRALRPALAGNIPLTQGFRAAEALLPALRQQAPHLVSRLARTFYWGIINAGGPDDIQWLVRVFGQPPGDPTCARLRALAFEHAHDLREAHKEWREYEKTIASHPEAWPDGQAKRVRALVWLHMGRNAASVPDTERIPNLAPWLREHPARPRPLSPSADKCFRKSLGLAPNLSEAHVALFEYHKDRREFPEAEAAGLALLERFPDHVATLEGLADLYMQERKYAEGLDLFGRALRANPLERRLRAKLSSAHTYQARARAEAGRFDEARASYQAALGLCERANAGSVYCKWAACEFKAGDTPRAEELLRQALAEAASRLAIAYSMVIEAIRLKLPPALKRRFDREFTEALVEGPTAAGAAQAAETAAAHRLAGVTYHGQKTHEKKLLAYVDRARQAKFTEAQLASLCNSLLALQALRPARTFARIGQTRFPRSAVFPFLEAESYFVQGPERFQSWQAAPLLEKAARLAGEAPRDEQNQALLEEIGRRRQMADALGPMGMEGLMDVFNELFGGDEDDGFE